MKLKYHRKLEFSKLKFPFNDKSLHILETVINCKIFSKILVFGHFDIVMGAFFKALIIFEDRRVRHIPNKLFSRSGQPSLHGFWIYSISILSGWIQVIEEDWISLRLLLCLALLILGTMWIRTRERLCDLFERVREDQGCQGSVL